MAAEPKPSRFARLRSQSADFLLVGRDLQRGAEHNVNISEFLIAKHRPADPALRHLIELKHRAQSWVYYRCLASVQKARFGNSPHRFCSVNRWEYWVQGSRSQRQHLGRAGGLPSRWSLWT